ncbi:MAG: hypothetical protein U9R60_05655 [Bacteroidota bacterium]|nr:hypothetical protein [Bacteroidota bacterium]
MKKVIKNFRFIAMFFVVAIFLSTNLVQGQEKEKKKKDEFKVYAGVSFNHLNIDSKYFESAFTPGFDIGGAYKRGKFFYWEVGVRYNNSVYNLAPVGTPDSISYTDKIFSARNIDVPITVGINILSITSRIVGLRVFISAIPSFTVGVGDNDIGITKDDLNSFNVLGQGGIGVDVAFIFIETGFSYGFGNIIKDINSTSIQSNPMQIYLNLGFRF